MAKQIGFLLLRASRTRTSFPLMKSRIPIYQGIRLQNTSSQSKISQYIEKTRNVFNEPFIKISLMALAAVMSATALYEYLYRGSAKKKNRLGIQILPVSPNHYCVEVYAYSITLQLDVSRLQALKYSLLRNELCNINDYGNVMMIPFFRRCHALISTVN